MGDDDSSVTTYRLTGTRDGRHRMRVDTGEESFDVDRDLNPVQYLLGSLIGCLNFTATTVAREMDIEIEAMDATVEGDIDYARYLGEETDTRAGLQAVRVTLTVDAAAGEDELAALLEAVERRCPVSETIASGTDLGVSVEAA
ncbi:MAG: OsmC family protein [Haloarculaceae archaeon]